MTNQEIISFICEKMEVSEEEIKGKSRKFEIVLARHIAMYFISLNSIISLHGIGEIFGKRDHSTVIHAYRRIEKDSFKNDKFKRFVSSLYKDLRGVELKEYQKRKPLSVKVHYKNKLDAVVSKLSA